MNGWIRNLSFWVWPAPRFTILAVVVLIIPIGSNVRADTEYRMVPELRRWSVDLAAELLGRSGLKLGDVEPEGSVGEDDMVVRQLPFPGMCVESGTSVDVFLGASTVSTPTTPRSEPVQETGDAETELAAYKSASINVQVEWQNLFEDKRNELPQAFAVLEKEIAQEVAGAASQLFGFFEWAAACPVGLPDNERGDCTTAEPEAVWIVRIERREGEFEDENGGPQKLDKVLLTHSLHRMGYAEVLLTPRRPLADPVNVSNVLYSSTPTRWDTCKFRKRVRERLDDGLTESTTAEAVTQLGSIPFTRQLAFKEDNRIVVPVQRCLFSPGPNVNEQLKFKVNLKSDGLTYNFKLADDGPYLPPNDGNSHSDAILANVLTGNGEIAAKVLPGESNWQLGQLLQMPQLPPPIRWVPGLSDLFIDGTLDESGEGVSLIYDEWTRLGSPCPPPSGEPQTNLGGLMTPEDSSL